MSGLGMALLTVFAVFCSALSAIGISFGPEFLGPLRFIDGETAKAVPLFCRCFTLFLCKPSAKLFPRHQYAEITIIIIREANFVNQAVMALPGCHCLTRRAILPLSRYFS